MRELELYVHIPFCVRKCAYCDFLSTPAGAEERQRYVDTLIEEIRGYRKQYQEYHVTTIFIGGGTPSILSGQQMEKIFVTLRESFDIDSDAEITIEVNPGTVTEEKAEAWKRAGINRISIGLQSVNDEELQMLGRIHTYREFVDTYGLLRSKGFADVNVDLISAIPGQTVGSWRKTLITVAELGPEHISAYSLIVEEGTPFYQLYGEENEEIEESKNNENCADVIGKITTFDSTGNDNHADDVLRQVNYLPLPDEDTERLIYEETEKILKAYGYHRYEISNYAKDGYECRHNEGYWRRTEYLGIGLGASSLIEHQRLKNLSEYEAYIDAVQNRKELHEEYEELSATDEMEEFMFLGLRMTEGISKAEFYKNFDRDIESVYGEQLNQLEADGLIESVADRIRLTSRGIDISNYVFEQFLL